MFELDLKNGVDSLKLDLERAFKVERFFSEKPDPPPPPTCQLSTSCSLDCFDLLAVSYRNIKLPHFPST